MKLDVTVTGTRAKTPYLGSQTEEYDFVKASMDGSGRVIAETLRAIAESLETAAVLR